MSNRVLLGCGAAMMLMSIGVQAQTPPPAAKPAAGAAAPPAASLTQPPAATVAATPKGKLANPYKDDNTAIVGEGQKLYFHSGCNGCHGGNGGGGMCPPLTNDIWVYGGDDDTLFRLVALGSDELQKQGYSRKGRESVVGPMPPFGEIIKNSDDLWKIFAFVRSKYSGDPAYKFGTPAGQ